LHVHLHSTWLVQMPSFASVSPIGTRDAPHPLRDQRRLQDRAYDDRRAIGRYVARCVAQALDSSNVLCQGRRMRALPPHPPGSGWRRMG
jgi:hypothetical protein